MDNSIQYSGAGWQSDLSTFHSTSAKVIRAKLQGFVRDAGPEQIQAWDQSLPWLQEECRALEAMDSSSSAFTAVLEYELPRDFRRPDVIILEHGAVVVLELKGRPTPTQAALDQVQAYARDLAAYHAACAGTQVVPVLVLGRAHRAIEHHDGVIVTSPVGLSLLLDEMAKKDAPIVSAKDFLREDAYAPLPSIVTAARELFHNRPLPLIKRARAATDPALNYITTVAHEAAKSKSRHLVLLSGVPGSGKTLVGLQLVHSHWLDDLAVSRDGAKPAAAAVYLSGNGPLVEVLQHALNSGKDGGKTFVQGIKKYVDYYNRPRRPVPPEHLLVFDEAQRAHDPERVAHVQRLDTVGKSEPALLLEFCERIPEWCVLVALIGEGQAIHVGEEGGIKLWCDALNASGKASEWTVHAAPNSRQHFIEHLGPQDWQSALNLDTELRFHMTPKVHTYVAGILDCKPTESLTEIATDLYDNGHRFLITRDLEAARNYLRERYADAISARYGLLASSKDKWLVGFGVDNDFQTTKRLRVGPWYNAPPAERQSCCQLDSVATEFASQGLELDCALLAWGSDLLWEETEWSIKFSRGSRSPIRDPLSLRKNVYRVLLTRGRDGTIIYVPQDTRLDATYEHLLECGLRKLN